MGKRHAGPRRHDGRFSALAFIFEIFNSKGFSLIIRVDILNLPSNLV